MKQVFLIIIVTCLVSLQFILKPSGLWIQQSHGELYQLELRHGKPADAAKENISCIRPLPQHQPRCAAQEQTILASVVRLVLHGELQTGQHTDFRGSFGHATVVNGRYLITHNHYAINLTTLSAANPQGVTGFSLYNASGQNLVRNAPVDTFQATLLNDQALILDFGEDYFTGLGLTSAPFKLVEEGTITIGTEVGQIDWDGQQTYLIWTAVTEVMPDDATPHLVLDNYVMPGASGGGVFWHGYHIANTWADVTVKNAVTGEFLGAFSLVALNSRIRLEPNA